jgi:hypothetical protein
VVGGRQIHHNWPKLLGKPLCKDLHPEFLSHLQKQWEDLVMTLDSWHVNTACWHSSDPLKKETSTREFTLTAKNPLKAAQIMLFQI